MSKQAHWGVWLALAILCSSPFAAIAEDEAPPQKLDRILAQQQELKRDLDVGKTDGLTTRQVNAIRKAQVDVFAVTEGKTTLDQLSMDDKVRLENALERINAEVKNTRAGHDEKQVCWRERMSGSNTKVTRCGTEAEMREAREGARDFLERPKVCGDRCG
ncbi:MAG TPA: hypothetical protein VGD42_22695 [Lysobacter sp.]